MFKKAAASIAQITNEDIAPTLRAATAQISELKADPANENVHSEGGLEALKHSLATHGQQIPVVVDKNLVIKKGHLTVEAAKALGWKVVAISQYHKDDDRASQFRIADNRVAKLSELDPARTAAAIQEALQDGFNYLDFGYTEAEFMQLLGTVDSGLEEALQEMPVTQTPVGQGITEVPEAREGRFVPADTLPEALNNAQGSNIRMVQIFLTSEQHGSFMEMCTFLGGKYGTGNITDTVYKAVAESYQARQKTES